MVMDELRGGECDDTELLTSIADIYNVLASPLFAALVDVHEAYGTIIPAAVGTARSSLSSIHSPHSLSIMAGDSMVQRVTKRLAAQSEFLVLPIVDGKLGFVIIGGTDHPNAAGDTSVYVVGIEPHSPIDVDGRLLVGDQIVTANGWPVQGLTLKAVQDKLASSAASNVVEMRVIHHDATPQQQAVVTEITINKGSKGLGVNIAGGSDQRYIESDPGLFITKIIADGAAHHDGRLAVGDQILFVNNNDVTNVDHAVAVQYLKQAGEQVTLRIYKNAVEAIKRRAEMPNGTAHVPVTATLPAADSAPIPPPVTAADTVVPGTGGGRIGASASTPSRPSIPMFITTRSVSLEGIPVVGSPSGYGFTLHPSAYGLFISHIDPSGLVAQCGDIQEGNKIVSINGRAATKMSMHEAVSLLQQLFVDKLPLTLEVTDPEPEEMESMVQRSNSEVTGRTPRPSISMSQHDIIEPPPVVHEAPPQPPPTTTIQPTSPLADHAVTAATSLAATTTPPASRPATEQPATGFYVRTLFGLQVLPPGHHPPGKALFFHLHEVLFVLDSSDEEWWHARSLDSTHTGYIPSALRIERQALRSAKEDDDTASIHSSRKRSISISIAKKFAFGSRRKSKSDDERPVVGLAPSVPSYEIVTLKPQSPTHARPLMILGPSKDFVVDHLFSQFPDKFGTAVPHTTRPQRRKEINGEDYHFVTVEAMEAEIQKGSFIEAGKYNGHLYGTSIKAIRDLAEKGKHCIVDVSAAGISRLIAAQLNPIVVFLHADTVAVVRKQNPTFDETTCHQAYELASKVEMEFQTMFTAVVNNVKLDDTFARVVDIFERETKHAFWASTETPLPGFTMRYEGP